MEEDFTCKTCGYVKGGVWEKRVELANGNKDADSIKPDPKADNCCVYYSEHDPRTGKTTTVTKPKEVMEGAECPHWISEEEAEKKHIPNYLLP